MQKEQLVEKAGGARGAYFQKKLKELEDHPLVGETRGVGMIGGIELVKDKKTREKYPSELEVGYRCRVHCFDNGLVMRAIGDTMVLSPPLVISESELDELFGLARRCIDLIAKDLGRA
jgi:putrescine aminotransferase